VHAARIGDVRNACRMFVGKLKGGDHLEDLRIDGKIVLKMDLKEIG
jgi:hypothetical protein